MAQGGLAMNVLISSAKVDSVSDLNLIKLAWLWSQFLGQNLVKRTPAFSGPFSDELAPTLYLDQLDLLNKKLRTQNANVNDDEFRT